MKKIKSLLLIIFTIVLLFGVTVKCFCLNNVFVDVIENEYYFDAVIWAYENHITTGTTNNTFEPESINTRGQMITFLYRYAGSPDVTIKKTSFRDVVSGEYYEKAVIWAMNNGITNGTDPEHFRPDREISRKEAITFLYRYFYDNEEISNNCPFLDIGNKDYWTQPIKWAYDMGISNGVTNLYFGIDDPCTRAQIVTFLYRIYQVKNGNQGKIDTHLKEIEL